MYELCILSKGLIVERAEMRTIQLLIKEADKESFKNWILVIYDPVMEKQSGEFYFFGPRLEGNDNTDCLLVGSLLTPKQFEEKVRPYLQKLCEYETIQILIGQYMYSKNKELVDKLVNCLQLMKPCTDPTLGILLYEEWEKEETKWREIKITTV